MLSMTPNSATPPTTPPTIGAILRLLAGGEDPVAGGKVGGGVNVNVLETVSVLGDVELASMGFGRTLNEFDWKNRLDALPPLFGQSLL